MFDPLGKLLLGLISGVIFGVLLQKGQVAKHRVIVGQLLLRDWTVAKIMGPAIAVGALGVWLLVGFGLADLHLKPAIWSGLVVGGVLFGIGMAVLGYCPGTTVAACGEGHRDAYAGLLGLLAGALIYVLAYPTMTNLAEAWGDAGKLTLADVTGLPPWIWIALLLMGVAVAWVLERSSRRPGTAREAAQPLPPAPAVPV